MMVSYTRARAESLGVALSGGIMQRAERIALVTCGSLIAAWCGASGDAVVRRGGLDPLVACRDAA